MFSFDARKAFYTIPHGALQLILRHLSVPPAVIDLLLYLHAAAQLHVGPKQARRAIDSPR